MVVQSRVFERILYSLHMGWFARATRSLLGLTPSHDQVASALLHLPPKAARAEVERMAAAALTAERAAREKSRSLRTHDATHHVEHCDPPRRPPVEVKQSLVPGAGSGLFMRRDVAAAKPGDLIALYAGVYTPPAPPISLGADGTSIIIPEPKLADGGRGGKHTRAHGR